MAEATPPQTPRGSPLAFALGEMTAVAREHTTELARQRDTIEALPGKLAIHFGPRFEALEDRTKGLDTRVVAMEGNWKFVRGAGWVLAALITVIGGKAFIWR